MSFKQNIIKIANHSAARGYAGLSKLVSTMDSMKLDKLWSSEMRAPYSETMSCQGISHKAYQSYDAGVFKNSLNMVGEANNDHGTGIQAPKIIPSARIIY